MTFQEVWAAVFPTGLSVAGFAAALALVVGIVVVTVRFAPTGQPEVTVAPGWVPSWVPVKGGGSANKAIRSEPDPERIAVPTEHPGIVTVPLPAPIRPVTSGEPVTAHH